MLNERLGGLDIPRGIFLPSLSESADDLAVKYSCRLNTGVVRPLIRDTLGFLAKHVQVLALSASRSRVGKRRLSLYGFLSQTTPPTPDQVDQLETALSAGLKEVAIRSSVTLVSSEGMLGDNSLEAVFPQLFFDQFHQTHQDDPEEIVELDYVHGVNS